MENSNHFCHENLLKKIAELKVARKDQEADIGEKVNAIIEAFSPQHLLKDSLVQLTTDRSLQTDAIKIATAMGTNYLIDKIVGRKKSIKGYLAYFIAKKISNSFIGPMIAKFTK